MHSNLKRRVLSILTASAICVTSLLSAVTPVSAATEVTLKTGPGINRIFYNITGDNVRLITTFRRSNTLDSSKTLYNIDANDRGDAVMWRDGSTAYWYSAASKVYLNSDSRKMFQDLAYMTTCDLSGLDTSRVTTMEDMFWKCKKIGTLDLSGFDTRNVTDMGYMFCNCPELKTLNLSNFNTSKVVNMSAMFSTCQKLTNLNISSFDTSKVETFTSMFKNCKAFTSLDLKHFDTSSATNLGDMFSGCSNLTTVKFGGGWDTSNVTVFAGMFFACNSLRTIYAWKDFDNSSEDHGGFEGEEGSNTIYVLFNGCMNLVGGSGTVCPDGEDDELFWTSEYARIDDPSNGRPGYFTLDPSYTPPHNHNWTVKEYTWDSSMTHVTGKTTKCSICNNTLTETVGVARVDVITAPSCSSEGLNRYTSQAFSNSIFSVQTKDVAVPKTDHVPGNQFSVENTVMPTCNGEGSYDKVYYCTVCGGVASRETISLPAQGHNWGTPSYNWSNDNSSVTATASCIRNGCNEVLSENGTVTTTVIKAATCTQSGSKRVTATFSNSRFTTQTKTVSIPATGHTPAAGAVENYVPETCTVNGSYDWVVRCSVCNEIISSEARVMLAKGHTWGTVNYSWTSDYSRATASCYCSVCNESKRETVNSSSSVVTQATCTVDGKIKYTASFTDPLFTGDTKYVTITATGHNWGTPTYNWSTDNSSVTAHASCTNSGCNEQLSENGTVTTTVIKAATCTQSGSKKVTATFSNSRFTTQTKTVSVPATGHTPLPAAMENYVQETCSANGSYDLVVRCAVCNTVLSSEHFVTMADHQWGTVNYSWTADNSRVTASCSCTICHTQKTETVNSKRTVISNPTCTTEGKVEYKATFTDPVFPADTRYVFISATGHKWGTPTYVWAPDNSTCTATCTCQNNSSHKNTKTVDSTSTVFQQATCENKGVRKYTAVFNDDCFSTQTKTLADIPATGHDWSDPVYTWTHKNNSQEITGVSAYRYCRNDNSHTESEAGTISTSVSGTVSCTESMVITYTASFNNPAFNPPAQTVTIPATGHSWSNVSYSWNADCSRAFATTVCSRCNMTVETSAESHVKDSKDPTCTAGGYKTYEAVFADSNLQTQTKTVQLQALGHNEGSVITENYYASACETRGHFDKVTYCTRCDAELSRQTVMMDALGHNWSSPSYSWNDDCSRATASVYCTRCDKTESETVNSSSRVTKQPTCTAAGERTFTASFTDSRFSTVTRKVSIPAKGHTAGTPVSENMHDATCTADGYYDEVTYCSVCSAKMQSVRVSILAKGHTPGEACEENRVEADYQHEGHFDSVVYCQVCGQEISRERITIPALHHQWRTPTYTWTADKSQVTARVTCRECSDVLTQTVDTTVEVKKDATCTVAGLKTFKAEFSYSQFTTQTKDETIPAPGHAAGAEVRENEVAATCTKNGSYDTVVYCVRCGEELSRTGHTITKTGHKPGSVYRENEVAATCTVDGSYDEVRYCTICGVVTSRNTVTVPRTGHSSTYHSTENSIPATCISQGSYDDVTRCTKCNEEISRQHKTLPKIDHVAGNTARENVVQATCTSEGSYNEVVYCKNCHREISRTPVSVPKLNHDPGYPIHVNEQPSSCTFAGSYDEIIKCRNCQQVISRTHVTLPLEDHVPGQTTVENFMKAGCVKDGSYDVVIYCKNCSGVISRTTNSIPATGHDWGEWRVTKEPTVSEDGVETRICRNDKDHVETRPIAKLTPTPGGNHDVTGTPSSVKLTIDKSKADVVCGKSITLKATLKGSTSKISWKVSDSKIASVDSNGKVTGKMAGSVTVTASAAGKSVTCTVQVLYKDVTDTSVFWYTPTYYLTNKGVVKGYDNQTKFKPANDCTRAQMVTFIWRLQGEPAPKTSVCKFTDVKKTDYFYKACLWGNENHIVEGYKNGTFGPQIICARKHAVTFLWRLAGSPAPKSDKCRFTDVKKTNYFYNAVIWASDKGIVAGYDDDTFRPEGNCLRRQMVTFLYKYDKAMNKK